MSKMAPRFFTEFDGVIVWLPMIIEMSIRILTWLGVDKFVIINI